MDDETGIQADLPSGVDFSSLFGRVFPRNLSEEPKWKKVKLRACDIDDEVHSKPASQQSCPYSQFPQGVTPDSPCPMKGASVRRCNNRPRTDGECDADALH